MPTRPTTHRTDPFQPWCNECLIGGTYDCAAVPPQVTYTRVDDGPAEALELLSIRNRDNVGRVAMTVAVENPNVAWAMHGHLRVCIGRQDAHDTNGGTYTFLSLDVPAARALRDWLSDWLDAEASA